MDKRKLEIIKARKAKDDQIEKICGIGGKISNLTRKIQFERDKNAIKTLQEELNVATEKRKKLRQEFLVLKAEYERLLKGPALFVEKYLIVTGDKNDKINKKDMLEMMLDFYGLKTSVETAIKDLAKFQVSYDWNRSENKIRGVFIGVKRKFEKKVLSFENFKNEHITVTGDDDDKINKKQMAELLSKYFGKNMTEKETISTMKKNGFEYDWNRKDKKVRGIFKGIKINKT